MIEVTEAQTAKKIKDFLDRKAKKEVMITRPLSAGMKGMVTFPAGHPFRPEQLHPGLAQEILRLYENGTSENPSVVGDIACLKRVVKKSLPPEKINHNDFLSKENEEEGKSDEEKAQLKVGRVLITKELITAHPELSKQGAIAGQEFEIGVINHDKESQLEEELKAVKAELYEANTKVKLQVSTIDSLTKEAKAAKTSEAQAVKALEAKEQELKDERIANAKSPTAKAAAANKANKKTAKK